MDRALLRPGRFGKLLYVPLPSPDERALILKALARKKHIDAAVDLSAIAKMEVCENLSGADLSTLMNEAAMAAQDEKWTLTDLTHYAWTNKRNHFELALRKSLRLCQTDSQSQKVRNSVLDSHKDLKSPLRTPSQETHTPSREITALWSSQFQTAIKISRISPECDKSDHYKLKNMPYLELPKSDLDIFECVEKLRKNTTTSLFKSRANSDQKGSKSASQNCNLV
ncbi:hypothetical protein Fmac_023817 [Flemingia macrophylla]|uniref:AAA ATPase AAA+ lid domain-containing protein n=1 Tax=Flemingia macrophylla TaxID=520843 RepID=A0ABD1LMN0_9FABA